MSFIPILSDTWNRVTEQASQATDTQIEQNRGKRKEEEEEEEEERKKESQDKEESEETEKTKTTEAEKTPPKEQAKKQECWIIDIVMLVFLFKVYSSLLHVFVFFNTLICAWIM